MAKVIVQYSDRKRNVVDLNWARDEIRGACRSIEGGLRTAFEAACHGGEVLLAVKGSFDRGAWQEWCAANVDLSQRSIRQWMQAARYRRDHPAEALTLSEHGLRGALKMIAAPKRRPVAVFDTHVVDASAAPPLEMGYLTVGWRDGEAALLLFESARHPGCWHSLDFRDDTTSQRPFKGEWIRRYASMLPAFNGLTWAQFADDELRAELLKDADIWPSPSLWRQEETESESTRADAEEAVAA